MKIKLVRQIFGEGDNDFCYKYKTFQYCCDKLKNNKYINLCHEFVVGDCEEECEECKNRALCDNGCSVGVMIRYDDTYPEPYEDYNTTDSHFYQISFCPFCVEPIEVDVVKEEGRIEEYIELENLRDELRVLCKNTDSKKREAELNNEIHKLNNKIQEFYEITEY